MSRANFFGREGQNSNGTKLKGSGSKFLNIREQNQNCPNLESIQCSLVSFFLFKYENLYIQYVLTLQLKKKKRF